LFHALQGKEKVAGSGTGSGDGIDNVVYRIIEFFRACGFNIEGAQGDGVGTGDTDSRGTSNFEFRDSRGDGTVVIDFQKDFFSWKECLVDYPDPVAEPFDGLIVYFYLPHPLCPPLLSRRGGGFWKRGCAPLKRPVLQMVGCVLCKRPAGIYF